MVYYMKITIKTIVSLIFAVLLVYSYPLGALAFNQPYMNGHDGDELQESIVTDNGYPEVTQNDSESTDNTDIKESADAPDTVETDSDEAREEILRKAVSGFYEERAKREKEFSTNIANRIARSNIAILCVLLIMKPAIAIAKKITNKNR